MSVAVLEPSVLSIEEDEWFHEESRDNYLEHFNTILTCISNDRNISLAWCEKIDELIWSFPQRPPWKRDRIWANTIIPIIYERVQKNAVYIDDPENILPCSIIPPINCDREEMYAVFLDVLGSLNDNCRKILIAFGLKNIPPEDHAFKIEENDLQPTPILMTGEVDFLNQIDVVSEYWPDGSDDSERLKKGISIILKRGYGLDNPVHDFQFSQRFLRKLSSTGVDRLRILNTIARRLTMNTSDAGRDGSLQDEGLEGRAGIRRFRITPRPSSKRIHYEFTNSGVEFLMFYDVGEHDDGL